MGVRNPYSLASTFLLYIYSIQLGEPPLFAVLNKEIREHSQELLPYLGAYQRALQEVTEFAEGFKVPEHRLPNGHLYATLCPGGRGVPQNFAGSMLAFRGAQMLSSQISEYEKVSLFSGSSQGISVRMSGNVSCSLNLVKAIMYAFKDPIPNLHIPVLFSISCLNYLQPRGVILNADGMTKFFKEAELLLTEGCKVYVMGMERGWGLAPGIGLGLDGFAGKEITLVYLFHPF